MRIEKKVIAPSPEEYVLTLSPKEATYLLKIVGLYVPDDDGITAVDLYKALQDALGSCA